MEPPLSLTTFQAAKSEAENIVTIPLGAGQAVAMPMGLVDENTLGDGLDLDEEQIEKLR